MKNLKKIIIGLFATVLLTGCYKIKITVDVDKEGTVNASMTTLVQESAFSEYGMDTNDIKESMIQSAKESYPEAEITELEEDIDGEKYVGYTVKSIDTGDYKAEVKDNVVTLTIPMSSATEGMEDVTEALGADESGEMTPEKMAEYGIEMKMIINMPAPAESNVGKVEGNKVTIDLLTDTNAVDTAVITAKLPTDGTVWIIAGIAAVVLIGLAVFFFTRKKNNPSGTSPVAEKAEDIAQKAAEKAEPVIEKVDEAADKAADKVEEAVAPIADKVEEAVEPAADKILQEADETKDAVANKVEEVKDSVEEKVEAVKDSVEETKEAVADKAEEVKDSVAEKVEAVKESIEETKDAVAEKAEDAAEEVKEAAADAVAEVKDAADQK